MAKDYVKNKELYNELVRCQDASLDWSPLLDTYIDKMVDKFANNFTYLNPMDRDDCMSSAKIDVYMYWHNFNRNYPNAFAYITQIVKRGFAKGWRSLHRSDVKFISISNNNIHTI